jgi:hypothetical protein
MRQRFAASNAPPPRSARAVRAHDTAFAALAWLSMGVVTAAYAGTLDDVRGEVRDDSKNQSGSSSHRDRGHGGCDDDDDESLLGCLLSGLFEGLWGNRHRDHCGPGPHGGYDGTASVTVATPAASVFFARYPYADDVDGFMMDENWTPAAPRTWSGRVWAEYGNDFDALDRWSGDALLESGSGWGVGGDWNTYTERLANGGHDRLSIGDVNVLLRFVETPQLQVRAGIGMNWLDDSRRTDFGLNGTLMADWYPRRPWVVSGELDGGWLGSSDTFHGSLSVGVMLNRVELFSGYDYRKIGAAELQGPMFGVRVWF